MKRAIGISLLLAAAFACASAACGLDHEDEGPPRRRRNHDDPASSTAPSLPIAAPVPAPTTTAPSDDGRTAADPQVGAGDGDSGEPGGPDAGED